MSLGRRVVLVSLVVGLFACTGVSRTGPGVSSKWRVSLVSPFPREGAAVIELRAPSHTFRVEQGTIVTRRLGDRVQVAVFLLRADEITFIVEGGTGAAPSDPLVLQVADGISKLRPSVDDYSVRIEAIP